MESSTLPKSIGSAQSSIMSFFQPRAPSYTAPPASANALPRQTAPPPSKSMTPLSPPPIAPKSASQTTENNLSPPSSSGLPQQASISNIQPKHVQPLKRINALLLPINYPDSFYHKIVDPTTFPNFSRAILWQDAPSKANFGSDSGEPKVVGGIVCRLDRDEDSRTSSIYIQSLVLLSPYRSYGLATAALDAIIASLVGLPSTEFPITSLYAHVWTENAEGLEWYKARGFTKEPSVINGYYSRLNPNSAWILRRSIVPSDHLRHSQTPDLSRTSTPNNGIPSSQVSEPPRSSTSTPDLGGIPPQPVKNGLRPRLLPSSRASSFQNAGPGHEWNDLPEDILKPSPSSVSLQQPLPFPLSRLPGDESAASSRSSSRSRLGDKGKKKRQYPAAAFGAGNETGTS